MAIKVTLDNDHVLQSNNFELFKSAENDYIRDSLSFSVTSDDKSSDYYFVKITVECSDYLDIGGMDCDDIINEEYDRLKDYFSTLSLIGGVSFSLPHGWTSSNWVHSLADNSCSCIFSRDDINDLLPIQNVSAQKPAETDLRYSEGLHPQCTLSLKPTALEAGVFKLWDKELKIKLNHIITFGRTRDVKLSFEFFDKNRKSFCSKKVSVKKEFAFLDSFKLAAWADKYTLPAGHKTTVYWDTINDGKMNRGKQIIDTFDKSASFRSFPENTTNIQKCTVSYMPPTIHKIDLGETDKSKILWDASCCSKSELLLMNQSNKSSAFIDVTNRKCYCVAWNDLKYAHFRFKGFLYQIDTVHYNMKQYGLSEFVSELEQTVYLFLDNGCRLMRLKWTAKNNRNKFEFRVVGVPLCPGYTIDTHEKSEWEFPFHYNGEDYSEILLVCGKHIVPLVL